MRFRVSNVADRLTLSASVILAVCIMVLPIAGAVRWYLAGERSIDLLVYDSTVPTEERRQHRAVDLALTYFKVPFDPDTDYVGAEPGGAAYGDWPAEPPDLALLVDAYGVYLDAEGRVDEDGTDRVTDSFPMSAAQDVAQWVDQGTVVMGEFNILHQPTTPEVSEALQEIFGIDAIGWTGRPVDDLREVGDAIRQLYDGPWDLEGPGIILVGGTVGDTVRDPRVIVLLPEHLESGSPIISGIPASNGRHVEISYKFWFALIESQRSADTLMWLELPVNEQGKALLEAEGVPIRAPFVVRTERTVYVAGNIATTSASFPTRRISGSLGVLQWLPNSAEADVFYEVYAPLVSDLLEQAGDRE